MKPDRIVCSRCNKERHERFFPKNAIGQRNKLCSFCGTDRRKKIIERRVATLKCSKCQGPPKLRDIIYRNGLLSKFQGEMLCDECLNPAASREALVSAMLDRSQERNSEFNDEHYPAAIDWFGDGV